MIDWAVAVGSTIAGADQHATNITRRPTSRTTERPSGRRPRPEQIALGPDRGHVGDTVTAKCDGHRHVEQHLARIVTSPCRPPLPQALDSAGRRPATRIISVTIGAPDEVTEDSRPSSRTSPPTALRFIYFHALHAVKTQDGTNFEASRSCAGAVVLGDDLGPCSRRPDCVGLIIAHSDKDVDSERFKNFRVRVFGVPEKSRDLQHGEAVNENPQPVCDVQRIIVANTFGCHHPAHGVHEHVEGARRTGVVSEGGLSGLRIATATVAGWAGSIEDEFVALWVSECKPAVGRADSEEVSDGVAGFLYRSDRVREAQECLVCYRIDQASHATKMRVHGHRR